MSADLLGSRPKRPPQIERASIGDAQFRHTLTRRWAPGPLVAWLMLNPSAADSERDDPTMCRVIEFTHAWGFPGCMVVNFAPFRSSSPAELWRWMNWEANRPDYHARDMWQANLGTVEDAGRAAALRIVAFGAEVVRRHEVALEMVLEALSQPSDIGTDERLYCLGTNAEGSPLHPMARGKWRVPDDTKPQLWAGFGVTATTDVMNGRPGSGSATHSLK